MAVVQRLEMRIDQDIKQLAERASAAAGCTLTDYVTRLIMADAPRVLKAQADLVLTNRQFDRFIKACENSPAPSARILKAAKRLDEEGF